jgi:hypothetical protein
VHVLAFFPHSLFKSCALATLRVALFRRGRLWLVLQSFHVFFGEAADLLHHWSEQIDVEFLILQEGQKLILHILDFHLDLLSSVFVVDLLRAEELAELFLAFNYCHRFADLRKLPVHICGKCTELEESLVDCFELGGQSGSEINVLLEIHFHELFPFGQFFNKFVLFLTQFQFDEPRRGRNLCKGSD